jgi:hypothetical protein
MQDKKASDVKVPLMFICRELLNALRDWEETQLAGAKVHYCKIAL